ncbi:ATP-binding protein DrrA1-3 family domain-containing protein, partial [Micromonospora sp. CPCC 205714]
LGDLRHLHRTAIDAEVTAPLDGLADLPGVHDLRVDGQRVRFDVDSASLDAALRRLTELGVRSLVSTPPTLEELFLRHYETAPASGVASSSGVARSETADRS